ncbi:MAG: hypothetical protein EBZ59_02770 [Planctomycetia bacterium]|nr:hypothetical protein [Planctomycetia bacterium]
MPPPAATDAGTATTGLKAKGLQATARPAAAVDPLPSWNNGPTKRAILDFLDAVTSEGSTTFVPVADRIAVFDHDGTLVCEKPIVHGMFLVDRIKDLARQRPELAAEEPYATLLAGDLELLRKMGKKFLLDLTFATLAGSTADDLETDVREFLEQARHPAFDVPYGDVTYQPMHELIAALRSRGFTVWICSGSGVHFMRPVAAAWYGIGPEHVIASRPKLQMREVPDQPTSPEASPNRRLGLFILPELECLNDREQKPVGIGERIGRRPIFAAGNVGSEGDIAMLRWSQSGVRPSLQLLVHHDDAQREMAYDEPSNASLEAAEEYGWHVVRMASDWNRVFARPLERTSVATAAATDPIPAGQAVAAPVSASAAASAASVAAPAEPPAAAAAVDPNGPPAVRWEEEIEAFAARDRQRPPEAGGVCFLGSSNVSLWSSLEHDFPGLNVLNRGVGGSRLAELAEFAPQLVAGPRPALVVVSAGGNDVGAGASAEEVRGSFARLVENVRKELPDVKIAFLAIAPSIKRWEQSPRQEEANAAVRGYIESGAGGTGLVFLDANAAFLGSDGRPAAECFVDDQQHPSTIGNGRRAAILLPALREIMD